MEWEHAEPPGGRRRARGLFAGLALVAVVTAAVVAVRDGAAVPQPDLAVASPTPSAPPRPADGDTIISSGPWTTLPQAPIQGREDHSLTWTGTQLLIWGGNAPESALPPATGDVLLPQADGAAYDPAAGTWTLIPEAPTPGRSGHTAVWTGRELLIWGGTTVGGPALEGLAYDPAADTWRVIADAEIPPRTFHTAVWTGTELLIWGGNAYDDAPLGGAYDPAADTWRVLPDAPVAPRFAHAAVWTGTEMLIWGGYAPGEGVFPTDGAAYDPATDTWRRTVPAPLAGRTLHTAVWDGTHMDVWGGSQEFGGGAFRTDGARYDPAADTWELLPDPELAPRFGSDAVWTGREFLVWGGVGRDFYPDGAAYDPATGRWRPIPPAPVRQPSRYPSVWTGDRLLTWSGTSDPVGVSLDPDA